MPIQVLDKAVHLIHGKKDLVLSMGLIEYEYTDDGEELFTKSISYSINMNGPQNNPKSVNLKDKSQSIVCLSFTDDEAIERLIDQLQHLLKAKFVFEENVENDDEL